jgi:hypothetical protein
MAPPASSVTVKLALARPRQLRLQRQRAERGGPGRLVGAAMRKNDIKQRQIGLGSYRSKKELA